MCSLFHKYTERDLGVFFVRSVAREDAQSIETPSSLDSNLARVLRLYEFVYSSSFRTDRRGSTRSVMGKLA
jgi:hypothetical protein